MRIFGNLYLVSNASFVKGSSSFNNGDQFHECLGHKKQRRVSFSLGEEEVNNIEHVDVTKSSLDLKYSFGNSSSCFSSSSEKLGRSQVVGVVRRKMKF